jgi:hypothetical protein
MTTALILSRRSFVAVLPLAFVACSGAAGSGSAAGAAEALPELVVYKTPTCGCCTAWVDHVRAAGFPVRTVEVEDTGPIAARHAVPDQLRSCHTAIVEGYAIEGHVPARDIRRLLAQRPAIAGIAVPGMPVGSPGMEMGERRDPFTVVAFTRDGRAGAFATY